MWKFLCLCIVLSNSMFILVAQEIKPEGDVKGFLDTRNALVNYNTGIFNYKIPLFELNSGDFKLPVTLSYMASGVQLDGQKPGTCGWGWNLVCGGVITRTLRGGIPDEDKSMGYATHPMSDNSDSTFNAVEKRSRDGESDIFTAVFNGQIVNFLLELSDDPNQLKAIPLEKTNIRIENVPAGEIPAWRITDENGIQYIFSEKEIMVGIGIEEVVSANSVTRDSCVSSWYLTRVIIPSSPDITFEYDDRYPYGGKQQHVVNKYEYENSLIYIYGQPMHEYAFNINPYVEQINTAVSDAKFLIQKLFLTGQMESANRIFETLESDLMANVGYLYENLQNGIRFYDNMYGLLTDLGQISESVGNVIEVLNDYIQIVQTEENNDMARLCADLKLIKNLYTEAITRKVEVKYRKVPSRKVFRIYPKKLASVDCGDKKLQLIYGGSDYFIYLKELTLYSYLSDVIGTVKLDINEKFLKKVSFVGKEGKEYTSQEFNYFETEGYTSDGRDWWGFQNGKVNGLLPYGRITDKELDEIIRLEGSHEPDIKYTKINTLKKVLLSTGGEVELDYEANDYLSGAASIISGGIRLKQIITRDETGKEDIVRYHYTLGNGQSSGIKLLTGEDKRFILEYENFSDRILSDRHEGDGTAIINTGNNGVMYQYVREERVGSGSSGYYYYIPYESDAGRIPEEGYSYFLCGLYLGKVDYDKDNQIVNIQKNVYYAYPYSSAPSEFFCVTGVPFDYASEKLQIKSSGLWFDPVKLENEYKNKSNVVVYHDNFFTYEINPYNDIYLPNLAPRNSIQFPRFEYILKYGGKVVLKEQKEYSFDSKRQTSGALPRHEDLFTPPSSVGYVENSILFYYGTKHTYPVRVTKKYSNGDVLDEYTWRVLDFATGSNIPEIINSMKLENVITPVVLQRSYLTKGNLSYIVGENVTEFEISQSGSKRNYLPSLSHVKRIQVPQVASLPGLDKPSSLFSGDKNKEYQKIHSSFAHAGGHCRVSEIESVKEKKAFVYDKGSGRMVMSAKGVAADEIDAIDYYRVTGLRDYQKFLLENCSNKDLAGNNLCRTLKIVPAVNCQLYTVALVVKGQAGHANNLNGRVSYTDGSSRSFIVSMGVENGYWQVLAENINLSDFSRTGDVSALEIDIPVIENTIIGLAVLYPEGVAFEATSATREGALFCKLNQFLQLERYGYDGIGRTNAIFDRNGNYVQRFFYEEKQKK